ncbi:MAG: hypothetical protein D6B27_01815 [Gammaproteobacteria bacterium]|nr:MAG: hypothetical protein D6B27_01815 [Gammaproteobacteria bacterium]
MKKTIFYFIMLTILASCSHFGNLDDMWNDIISSKSAEEEANAVNKLWDTMPYQNISLEISVLQPDGKYLEINKDNNFKNTNKFKIIFFQSNNTYQFLWSPIDKENLFLFFRE